MLLMQTDNYACKIKAIIHTKVKINIRVGKLEHVSLSTLNNLGFLTVVPIVHHSLM